MENKITLPKVTKATRISFSSWNKLYDFVSSKLDPNDYSICDLLREEEIESIQDTEWERITKKFTHYYTKNGEYVCSHSERIVDRKFRYIGGPLNGTNSINPHFMDDYSIYNNGDSSNKIGKKFSAVLIHNSLVS